MNDIEREPCPHCGEPAALAGRICPHCSGSLLVDILAESGGDERTRYRAARALASLGAPFPSFLEAQRALASPAAVLSAGLTRAQARAGIAALETHGSRGRIVPTRIPAVSAAGVLPLKRSLAQAEKTARFSPITPWVGGVILGAGAAAALLLFMLYWQSAPSVPAASPRVEQTPAAGRVLTTRELARRTLVSAASLTCPRSGGAGFFVTPELLLTNDHVLCPDGEALTVRLRDGRELPARALRRDDWKDLALVSVPGAAATPLPMGDATEIEAGDRVLAIGSPRGLEFSLAEGIVSHAERNLFGIAYIQFDGNINPGNSGGPLLDARGHAVGVVSMMAFGSRGLALALPINYAYEGDGRLLPPPAAGSGGERWQSVLARVKRADLAEVRAAASASSRPGLSSAAVTPEGDVVAVLLSRGWRANGLTFRFSLRRNGAELCSPRGVVESWESRGTTRLNPSADDRYFRWLEKNGITREVWMGIASLRWESCPAAVSSLGAELALLDGDARADRAILRPIETRFAD